MQTSDELMIELRRTGDWSLLEQLWERHNEALLGWIRTSWQSLDADDEASNVWKHVYLKRDRFKAMGNFEGWLWKVTQRRCINADRKMKCKHRKTISLSACGGRLKDTCTDYDPEDSRGILPDDDAAQSEIAERVRNLVESLEPEERQLLDLIYFQGVEYKEASESLGIEINTTRQRKFRLLKSLYTRLHGADWAA